MITYKSFRQLNINTESVGFIPDGKDCDCFCTPVGAEIIGSTGVDGIHYCFIKGCGDTVFSVNPMYPRGACVYPVAESFEMFLRLLLSFGCEAAIEMAHCLNRKCFDDYLSEYQPDEEQQAVLCELKEKLNLQPLDNPYDYIKAIQSGFDYSFIEYKPEYYDDPEPDEEEYIGEWEVYYHGNFWGHSDIERAGQEISIGKHFLWGNNEWYIPAAYSCESGLVVDFCVRVEPKRINEFNKKYGFDCEGYSNAPFELIDAENPMQIDFNAEAVLDGRSLCEEESCCETWYPEECLQNDEENDIYAECAAEHYSLDKSYGWIIYRSKFRYADEMKPEFRTLSLTFAEQPCAAQGIKFSVEMAGEKFDFVHPITGARHTLEVLKYEREELPFSGVEYCGDIPNRCIAMSYDIVPPVDDESFSVCDLAPNGATGVTDVGAVAVIGGCDGPTAIYISTDEQPQYRTALSSLHSEFPDSVEWQMIFYNKMHEDITVKLI